MVRASASGAIDFKACDHSRRWWTGARMKLRAVEEDLRLQVLSFVTERAIGLQGMHDLGWNPEKRQQYAIDAIMEFQAEAMPWFGPANAQNVVTEDQKLDAIAQWYLTYGYRA